MASAQRTAWMIVLLIGAFTSSAHAKKVVVPPFYARSTSSETVLSMTTLIASEIELMGEFDEVQQLDKKPSGWGSSCMSSSSCLRSIANKYGAQAVVGGSVSKRSDRYDIKLVYFENGKIVRTESTKIEISPMAVADGLATYARFVVTGVDPEAKKKEARVEGFEAGGVDFLDEEEEDDTPLVLAPTVSRRIATPPSSSRLTDDFEDPEPGAGLRLLKAGLQMHLARHSIQQTPLTPRSLEYS